MCLIAWVLSYPLIKIFYGEEFLPVVNVFRLLLPVIIASAIVIPANAYYNSVGKPGRILPYLVPIALLYICLLFLFIPSFGIEGAAIALSIKQIILAIIYLYLLPKHGNIPIKYFLLPNKQDIKLASKQIGKLLTNIQFKKPWN